MEPAGRPDRTTPGVVSSGRDRALGTKLRDGATPNRPRISPRTWSGVVHKTAESSQGDSAARAGRR